MKTLKSIPSDTWLILSLLMALLGSPAEAKNQDFERVPPQPVPQAVKVSRGARVEIPLSIYGSRSQTLEFRIRVAPVSGKLGPIQQTGKERASVSYQPTTDLAVTEDKFSYVVRSQEGVSAPAEVTIVILDAPPALVAPATLEFGSVLPGTSTQRTLEISNQGGGMATGQIEVPAPWKILGNPNYQLKGGDTHVVKVLFAPSSDGSFRGEARLTSQTDRFISLSGEALAPVVLAPAKLELNNRSGNFEIHNQSGQAQEIQLKADPRLHFERNLQLSAGEKKTVAVELGETDAAALDTRIEILKPIPSPGISVSAAASPAAFGFSSKLIDFGTRSTGTKAQEVVDIKNHGGVAATGSLSVEPPFSLDTSELNLEPGASKQIRIQFSPTVVGGFRSELTFTGPATLSPLLLKGLAIAPISLTSPATAIPPREIPSRETSSTPPSLEPPPQNVSQPAREIEQPQAGVAVPTLQGLRLVAISPQSATAQWTPPTSDPVTYRAEIKELDLQDGQLVTVWVVHNAFHVNSNADTATAILSELSPGKPHLFRITCLDPQGQPLAFGLLEIFAPSKPSLFFTLTPLRCLFGLLLLLLGTMTWQRLRK